MIWLYRYLNKESIHFILIQFLKNIKWNNYFPQVWLFDNNHMFEKATKL